MKPYDALAKYYNRFTENDCDYEKWSQYLYAQLRGAEEGVDLACGTGKMTRLLAKKFKVTGIDESAEMLREATSCGTGIAYVRERMQSFLLPHPVDFVTAVNDGVNYLPQKQLAAFFDRVYGNLKDGGKFIFDVSSEYKLRSVVSSNVFYLDEEDVTLLWNNRQKDDCVVMDVTLFEKLANGLYQRSDSRHVQYFHSEADVTATLQNVGFTVKTCDCYSDKVVKPDSLRITFCAVKG